MKKDNVVKVLDLLINELHIPVTHQSIADEMEKYPECNSLLAISDLLNNWHIPNAGYQLSAEKLLTEIEVPVPFVAHLSTGKGSFVLVSHMDEKYVTVSNENWNKHQLSIEEFRDIYSGAILVAEKETDSGEIDYPEKRRREIINEFRTPFVISSAIVLFIALLLMNINIAVFNWQTVLIAIFKTTGLITSILLLIQSIDANNPLIQKLCGGENNKSCNNILSSKAAKISNELSWSEIGFFYFAGTWLVLLFNSGHNSLIQILALLNLISLPYTFYSIYYQWQVAKQWCLFCCTVQGLLWLEFFAFLPYLQYTIQLPNLRECCYLIIDITLPVLTWVFIKPYLLKLQQMQPLKQQLHNFKYNTELFNKLLDAEVKYILPDEEHSLIIGNREAEHIITMVSNPYCPPCSKTHKKLDEWLANRDDIKLQVIFSIHSNGDKAQVVNHLLSLQSGQNDITLKKALNDWYEQKQKNYEVWAKAHPIKEQKTNTQALEKQREWCELTEITYTPTLFINGQRLPDHYQLQDIKYLI